MVGVSRIDWLQIAAGLCILTALGVVFFGGGKPFWYDEIFTLGAASLGPGPDWDALRSDVHPPTYPVMVWALGHFTGPTSPWLRLVNLPAALALLWALIRVRRILGRDRLLVLICLVLCNLYFLQMALDLRSYFWLLSFALLGHVALAEEVFDGRPRTLSLIVCASVLTALHHFGAAIGLALLGVSALWYLRQGRFKAVVWRIGAAAVLVIVFLIWVIGLSDTLRSAGGKLWISGGIGPWLDFVGWQVPVFMLLLAMVVFIRATGVRLWRPAAAIWILGPMILVVFVIQVISLHTPVISVRNLIVLVPGLSLATVLILPGSFVTVLRKSWLAAVVLLLFCLRFADTGIRAPQYIDWAITRATPPECSGAPLYFLDPGIVESYAQALFVQDTKRPYRNLTAFDPAVALPENCKIVAAGWHQRGTRDEVTAFFLQRGIDVVVLAPPDRRLAASPNRTSGYVVTVP